MDKERVAVYIDGFNLYFGMTESYDDTKWLDVLALGNSFVKGNQFLVSCKYFTSRIANDPAKQKRQSTYLDALGTLDDIDIYYGQYNSNKAQCKRCHHVWYENKEKMTDVNIATEMLMDAMLDKFDVAILVSGDSDLVPPIKAIYEKLKKNVIVAFPPNRFSHSLKITANGSFLIGKNKLLACQLPSQVVTPKGFILSKPKEWS